MQRSIEQLPGLNAHLNLSSNSGRYGGLVEFIGYEIHLSHLFSNHNVIKQLMKIDCASFVM